MPKKLLFPDAVRDLLVKRFNNQHQNWLAEEGTWPLQVSLGTPTERDIAEDAGGVREWVSAWDSWTGRGEVIREQRQFGRLGTHSFPVCMSIESPAAVAAAVGQAKRWNTAAERFGRMATRWDALRSNSVLTSKFSVLADYSTADFERLVALLEWLDANQASNQYLRQLPVEGLDTKWIEQRRGLVVSLLRAIRGVAEDGDFYDVCGLQRPPHRVRVRVLCPALRARVGGLRDIEAPLAELALLQVAPTSIVIVENQETGMALPDIAGTVAIMRLGNAVSVLQAIPWLQGTKAVYWGDIDTHGFAILDRARRLLPNLRSVLMDEATLQGHRTLWGQEPTQAPPSELAYLSEDERAVCDGLHSQRWGPKVRLEQERLRWDEAVRVIEGVLVS